jgi:hypothetical protein
VAAPSCRCCDLDAVPEGVLLLWPLFYVTQWIMDEHSR